MPSPFRVRNWVIFLLINVLVSATTAFIVVRAFTQAVNRPAITQAEDVTGWPASNSTADVASSAEVGSADAPLALAQTTPIAAQIVPLQRPAEQVAPTVPRPTVQPAAGAAPLNVRISTVVYPGQRTREAVVIVNEGEAVDLTGWTLSNPRGKVYTFSNVALFKESFINLHTTAGVDVQTDLFWNQTEAVWRVGDEVVLRRGDEVIATYIVK